MPITDTPLRYPGGKSQLSPLVVEIIKANRLINGDYIEPFAGGAGIAMFLVLNGYVTRAYLNDIDPLIYAFWYSVLHETEELCYLIESSPITVEERERWRLVMMDSACSSIVKKGFSTLFMNRTSRSGILRGGVIGGKGQDGKYKIDCRFNRADLVRKIKRISLYKDSIFLSCMDAAQFISDVVPKSSSRALVNLDPPYFCKGPGLYTNFYNSDDHEKLAQVVGGIDRPWIVTYDDAPYIRGLYANFPMYLSGLNYSAQTKRVGVELLIVKPGVVLPSYLVANAILEDC